MITPFKVIKIAFFYIAAIIPLFIGITAFFLTGGKVIDTALVIAAFILIAPFILSKMFNHPFLKVLEGEGLPILSFGSSGIIQPYLATPRTPEMSFTIFGKKITQMLSRPAGFSLRPAKPAVLEESADELVIRIPKKNIEDKVFNVLGRPGFVYNEATATLITKDLLSEKERGLFVDHNALYIVRKIEEVSSNIKENADLAIALLGKKKMNIPPWLIYIAIAGAVLLLLYLAWPSIQGFLGGVSGVGSKAVGGAGAAVTPLTK